MVEMSSATSVLSSVSTKVGCLVATLGEGSVGE